MNAEIELVDEKPMSTELCRLCANADNQFIPIFQEEGIEHNISEQIRKYLPIIKVTQSDELPLQICYQCTSMLLAWHNFFEHCRVADNQLREIVSENAKFEENNESHHDFTDDLRDDFEDQVVVSDRISDDTQENTNLPVLNVDDQIMEISDNDTVNISEDVSEPVIENLNNNRCAAAKTSARSRIDKPKLHPLVHPLPSRHLSSPKKTIIKAGPVKSKPSSRPPIQIVRPDSLPSLIRNLQQRLLDLPIDTKKSAVLPRSGVHPSRGLVCQTCGKSFSKKCNFRLHTRGCTPKPVTTLRCSVCSREFAYLHSLRRHQQKCENAGGEMDTRDTCSGNQKDGATKTDGKNVPPKLIDKVAGTDNLIDRVTGAPERNPSETPNDNAAADPSPQQTSSDGNSAATSEKVAKDSKSEVKELSAIAALYDNSGKSKIEMPEQFEKMAVMIDGRRCFQCDRCSYTCVVVSRMRLHYSMHTGERRFTCEQCGRQFRLLNTLRTHIKSVHEGVRQFGCEVCGRFFSEKRYLQIHRNLHAGKRQFVCDMCGARFGHLPSLQAHQRTHSPTPSFRCQICPNTYMHIGSFRMHMKRHRGELNYRCDVCGKAFIDRQHLSRHQAVHSEERPFECDVCGASFKLTKYLQSHKKTHGKVTVTDLQRSIADEDSAEQEVEDDSSVE